MYDRKKGRVKLIDFGLSERIENGKLCDLWCGSQDYVCPEIIKKEPYNGFAADVWSLGTILVSFYTLHPLINLDQNWSKWLFYCLTFLIIYTVHHDLRRVTFRFRHESQVCLWWRRPSQHSIRRWSVRQCDHRIGQRPHTTDVDYRSYEEDHDGGCHQTPMDEGQVLWFFWLIKGFRV